MANTFGNGVYNEQFWAAEMEEVFQKENVALGFAETKLEALLSSGDVVHKAYGTYPTVTSYTKGTAITIPDYTGTDETLTVDTAKVAPMYIDDIDKMQNKWSQAEVFAKRAGRSLNNVIDQAVFSEYSNATHSIVASDMGGSGSGTFVPNTSNIANLFTVAGRKLDMDDVGEGERFATIGPKLKEILRLAVSGRETSFGDTVGQNGIIGKRFGFDIFYSNNLPYTATWTPANNPTTTATITIRGVTFTFVDTIGTTAGNVHIGSVTADTLDNLSYAINNTGGTEDTDWVAVSKKDRWRLLKAGVACTESDTALSLTGYGDIVVTTSESNDPWSAETQYPLFGVKKKINIAVQKAPNVVFKEVSNKLGRNVLVWTMYGKKTFTEDADGLCYATVDTSAWT